MSYRQLPLIGGHWNRTLCGLAVDRHGHLYAAGDSHLCVFNASGRIERRWPCARPALAVAVAPDGAIYAGESGQIEIFDPSGTLLHTWNNPARLGRVTAIGFTHDSVLAADANDRAIRRFDPHGVFRNNIGKNNPVNGFLIPNRVLAFAVDAEGIIHAANPGKHRVERYTPEDQLLGHLGRFHGTDPAGFGGCCNPTNVAVADRLYVTEKAGPRAKLYNFDGQLEAIIAAEVFDPNCKNMSLAVDRRGRVYVADTIKLAIRVFEAAL